jgi:hypothetical protein
MYTDSIGSSISNSLDVDRGYLGIEAYHANTFILVKSSKNHHLTKKEKAYTKKLGMRETGGH